MTSSPVLHQLDGSSSNKSSSAHLDSSSFGQQNPYFLEKSPPSLEVQATLRLP